MNRPNQTAHDFFAAVERSDWTAVRQLSSSDAVFVQHVGPSAGTERSIDDLIELLTATASHLGSFVYTDVRRQESAQGFAQVHTLTFTKRPDMAVIACVVAWLDEDYRIARVDEFIDPSPFQR